jgi:hypothetical protein
MAAQKREASASVVDFAPKKAGRDESAPAGDAGHGIVALLHKAAESAQGDCARAMDLAHKLTLQLRAVEERACELEAEANYFRERAAAAENWLLVIHNEVEQTFFQNKGGLTEHK